MSKRYLNDDDVFKTFYVSIWDIVLHIE